MNQFFTSIYSWFCDRSLAVFKMMGSIIDEDTGDLILSSSFTTIGLVAAIISFLATFAFYIWPINHPRFKAWWAWLIMLTGNFLINFGLGFAFVHHRIGDIQNSEEAIELFEEFNHDEVLSLPTSQWIDFAFANGCISILFFIFFSLILTWMSSTCKYSPFRS